MSSPVNTDERDEPMERTYWRLVAAMLVILFMGCQSIPHLPRRESSAAAREARSFLQSEYPSYRFSSTSLRAREETRYVFAVFYTRPDVLIKPAPYKLVAVNKNDHTCEELECSPDSPYWIRGRK